MKISITGGTSTVGKALVDSYQSAGHTVVDISRSKGYDFNDLDSIVNEIVDTDIFVNCLCLEFLQTKLLYKIHGEWIGSEKTIVNISSASLVGNFSDDDEIDLEKNLYRHYKKSLEDSHWYLLKKNNVSPRMILLRVCLLNEESSWKDLSDFIVNTIHQKTYVYEMSVTI